ncbi:MAG: uncharacterized protein KVP18_004561 [Porospora cf. gigantea A]|nr:MAG: hypothetical protein KVP18_004561 [Porospora cf. gigantea A]
MEKDMRPPPLPVVAPPMDSETEEHIKPKKKKPKPVLAKTTPREVAPAEVNQPTEPTKVKPTKVKPTKVKPTKVKPTKAKPTKLESTKVESTDEISKPPAIRTTSSVSVVQHLSPSTHQTTTEHTAHRVGTQQITRTELRHKIRSLLNIKGDDSAKISEREINELLRLLRVQLSEMELDASQLDTELVVTVMQHLQTLLDSHKDGRDIETNLIETWTLIKQLVEHIDHIKPKLVSSQTSQPLSPFGPCLESIAESCAKLQTPDQVALERVVSGVRLMSGADAAALRTIPSGRVEVQNIFERIHKERSKRSDSIFSLIERPIEDQHRAITSKTIRQVLRAVRTASRLLSAPGDLPDAVAEEFAKLRCEAEDFVTLHRALRKLDKHSRRRGLDSQVADVLPSFMEARLALGRLMDILAVDVAVDDVLCQLKRTKDALRRLPEISALIDEARTQQLEICDDSSLYAGVPSPMMSTKTIVTNVTSTTKLRDVPVTKETQTHVDVLSPASTRTTEVKTRSSIHENPSMESCTVQGKVVINQESLMPSTQRVSNPNEAVPDSSQCPRKRKTESPLVPEKLPPYDAEELRLRTLQRAWQEDPVFNEHLIRQDPQNLRKLLKVLSRTTELRGPHTSSLIADVKRYLRLPDPELLEAIIAQLHRLIDRDPCSFKLQTKRLETHANKVVRGVVVESLKRRESRAFVWSVRPAIEVYIPDEKIKR